MTPLVTNFAEKNQEAFPLRSIAASLANIYSSNDPIGEKNHRKDQSGCPLRDVAASLANIYSSNDPIGDKIHLKKSIGVPFEVHNCHICQQFIIKMTSLVTKFAGGGSIGIPFEGCSCLIGQKLFLK